MSTACCGESNCKRKKPILLTKGAFSGAWLVFTDYTDDGEGRVCATAKHALAPDAQDYLNAMEKAADWAMTHGYPNAAVPVPTPEKDS